MLCSRFPSGCLQIFLLLTLLKLDVLKQLYKIDKSSFSTTDSLRNFGITFDEHLSFSDHVSGYQVLYRLHTYIYVLVQQ